MIKLVLIIWAKVHSLSMSHPRLNPRGNNIAKKEPQKFLARGLTNSFVSIVEIFGILQTCVEENLLISTINLKFIAIIVKSMNIAHMSVDINLN